MCFVWESKTALHVVSATAGFHKTLSECCWCSLLLVQIGCHCIFHVVDICAYTCLHNRIRLFHEPKYHPTSTNTSFKDHETGAMGSHSAITEQGLHWYRHFWWPSAWKALKSYPMKWNMLTSLRAKDRFTGLPFFLSRWWWLLMQRIESGSRRSTHVYIFSEKRWGLARILFHWSISNDINER